MMRSAVLSITNRSFTKKLVSGTRAGRAVAQRFVAGDTLEEAVVATKRLNEQGMPVSLDHLGEHVNAIEEADAATASYLACLDAIRDHNLDANISVKLTQLGMGLDDTRATRNLERLAEAAGTVGTTVTVDMEESAYTERTIDIYESIQRSHGNVGIAIQAYLRRSPRDLDRITPLGGHVRLCKGAYAEPESLAYQTGSEVDAAFDRLGEQLMRSAGTKPAIASHDDGRIEPILRLARDRSEPWEFQMLYGVRRDRQAELVALGHAMRVYVPYGIAWYPYLTRRLAERPANVVFFARALVGG
jgi:proline dehydrogenase